MTEAMTTTERRLTVADYEARIWLYREQIGGGFVGIGRTLNEAKAAGVVPAGQWEEWMVKTTGLTVRQAQRCMQAAREIRDGSQMARLEMSKAMRLLSAGIGEDEREELARRTADGDLTVKALEEEIRKLKAASEQAVEQSRAWEQRARESFEQGRRAGRIDRAEESTRDVADARQKERQAREAADSLRQAARQARDDLGESRLQADRLRGQLHEAEQRAEHAERALHDLQANQQQRAAEEYYKGRNEGMREITVERDREQAEHREALERMQQTIDAQQDEIDRQLTELSELRKKDRQQRMDEARGGALPGGARPGPVGEVQTFLARVAAYQGGAYVREDRVTLENYLKALERWIGTARQMAGVHVDGSVR